MNYEDEKRQIQVSISEKECQIEPLEHEIFYLEEKIRMQRIMKNQFIDNMKYFNNSIEVLLDSNEDIIQYEKAVKLVKGHYRRAENQLRESPAEKKNENIEVILNCMVTDINNNEIKLNGLKSLRDILVQIIGELKKQLASI